MTSPIIQLISILVFHSVALYVFTHLADAVHKTSPKSENLSYPTLRFKLDRQELTPSKLDIRSIRKPYALGERIPSTSQHLSTSSVSPAISPLSDQNVIPSSSVSFTAQLSPQHFHLVESEMELAIPMRSIPKEHGYTITVSIGASSNQYPYIRDKGDQLFNLLVDTGSDLVVVTSAACTDQECLRVQHRYDSLLSQSAAPTINHLTNSSRWEQVYGDGTIANGTLIQDTLRFISSKKEVMKILDQPILMVDQAGLHLAKSYGDGVDGILGMNLRSLVANQTIIQNLRQQKAPRADNNVEGNDHIGYIGLWLGKSLEAGQGGELILNGVDTSKFQGPIVWSNRGPSPFDWSVPLDRGIILTNASSSAQANVVVDPTIATSQTIANTTVSQRLSKSYTLPMTEHTFAVLDSGSDGIYLQRPIYDALFEQIPNAKQLKTGYWRVPCEGNLDLEICIQGEVYRIPYRDWVKKPTASEYSPEVVAEIGLGMCQTKVFGSSPGPTLLGATFMRTVYVVLDFQKPGFERIGLARLVSPVSSIE
ncbi:hypothetical protein FBU30_006453 [Linnemannia zychae]|nr:hypothetical protein FBU30_006453 [Linnemannia zychae]